MACPDALWSWGRDPAKAVEPRASSNRGGRHRLASTVAPDVGRQPLKDTMMALVGAVRMPAAVRSRVLLDVGRIRRSTSPTAQTLGPHGLLDQVLAQCGVGMIGTGRSRAGLPRLPACAPCRANLGGREPAAPLWGGEPERQPRASGRSGLVSGECRQNARVDSRSRDRKALQGNAAAPDRVLIARPERVTAGEFAAGAVVWTARRLVVSIISARDLARVQASKGRMFSGPRVPFRA